MMRAGCAEKCEPRWTRREGKAMLTNDELARMMKSATDCSWAATPEDVLLLVDEVERLRGAGLALCKTLRHWHDNGGFECDSAEHRDLEIVLGDTGCMIGAQAALDAAGES
jgi:hypothetical protein